MPLLLITNFVQPYICPTAGFTYNGWAVGFGSSVEQVAVVRDSLAEVEVEITKYMANGMIITGGCCSSALSK